MLDHRHTWHVRPRALLHHYHGKGHWHMLLLLSRGWKGRPQLWRSRHHLKFAFLHEQARTTPDGSQTEAGVKQRASQITGTSVGWHTGW